jgi:DNA-binding NarL/FixJ family response regulator
VAEGHVLAIRVLIADDDDDVQSALCEVFTEDPRFVVVAVASNGIDAVSAVSTERPDLVVLDVRMPNGGVEAARAIRASGVPATVIAVSARVDAALVAAMLHAGARGVLIKGRIGHDLPDLAVRCCAGEVVLGTPAASEGLKLFMRSAAVSDVASSSV